MMWVGEWAGQKKQPNSKELAMKGEKDGQIPVHRSLGRASKRAKRKWVNGASKELCVEIQV